jgi:hypothetical protein
MKGTIFFKIRDWIDKDKSNLYVFVGNNHDKNVSDVLHSIETKQSIQHLTRKDIDTLQRQFGRRYESTLSLKALSKSKVYYIETLIKLDDNINWLKRKLFYHLQKYVKINSHDDMYLWINKHFEINTAVLQSFISNCFKLEKRISFEYFSNCVNNYFGVQLSTKNATAFIDKNQARIYINDIKDGFHTEPLFFKYTNDIFYEYVNYNPLINNETKFENTDKLSIGSYDSLLLESFGVNFISDGVINMITSKSVNNPKQQNKYFPFSSQKESDSITKFVEEIEKTESKVNNYTMTEGYNSSSYTNFLHIRTNELNFNEPQDLEKLFETLTTSSDIPFIKYKSISNTFYKVNKDSMVALKNDLLGKWTETKIIQSTGKTKEASYIILKIHYKKGIYCSLLITDTLSYDLKFTFGSMMRETDVDILQFIRVIDNIILKVKHTYPHCDVSLIDRDFTSSITHNGNTKVIKWLTSNNVKSDKVTINYNNFNSVIQNRLYSYFNVIRNPNKNILHLQYKKVENYLNYEVIQVFITNHFVKDKTEMIRRITSEFVLSNEDAEKEYEKWLSQNEIEILKLGDKVFIKPRSDNFVNIKIRLTSSIDLNFNIEGAKSTDIQKRIINLLCILIDMSNEKVIIDKNNNLLNKVDTLVYGQKEAFNSSSKYASKKKNDDDIDNLDLELNDYNDFDDFELDLFEDDEELKALEMEFLKEAQQQTQSNQPSKKTKNANDDNDDDEDDDKKPKDEDTIMKSYFMNMLKSADRELIDYKVPKGQKLEKRYSTVCQWNDRRQPVVVNKDELNNIKKFQPDIKSVKTGSTPELQEKNFYICPQVWCPKSKVALKYKDFKEKYNEQCPYPDIEEKPILLTNHYWGKGEKGQSREHFPGFLDAFKTHPKKYCLPCCFKKEAKEGNKNKQKENTCKNQWSTDAPDEEELEVFGNEKYIKGEIFVPLESNRFGLLPKEINDLLGNLVCGNGFDGKGLMNDKTNCILRKGINQKSQSFLSALITLLDNPNINSVSSFVDYFNTNISIEQFISLENGKIMKLFINREYDVYNPVYFREFVKWIISSEQKAYVKAYKLKYIVEELKQVPLNKTIYSTSTLKRHKSILREFLIYNAYIHFIKYINDASIEKNHNLLIDYVQTENSWLNIQHYNIVIIEHEPTENKTYMLCPFNRNAKKVFDTVDPFVFIFKQNNYYEPLCHVKISRGDIIPTTKFYLKTAPEPIKKLLGFYLQNCSTEASENTALDIEIYLGTLTGRKIRRYVIDYSFRVCGFLISGINLFVPLKQKVDIYDLKQTEFIYYDEVPLYKCALGEKDLEEVFKKIYKKTGDNFYKLSQILYADDNSERIVGIILDKSYFVPINYSEKKDYKYVSDLLEDDLNIFIEYEKDDARKQRIAKDQDKKVIHNEFIQSVQKFISQHEKIQQEINFILDKNNPFPKVYRRKKLVELVQKILTKTNFVEKVTKDINLSIFTGNYVEDMLSNHTRSTHDVILKQMFGVKKKFRKEMNEIVFDQRDVIEGKLAEKIKFVQNPYSSLMDRIDRYVRDYIFDGYNRDELDAFKKYYNQYTVYEDVPYKFRKILQNSHLIQYDENTPYTQNTLYEIFLGICKAKGMAYITDIDTLKLYVQRYIVQGFKENGLDEFYENPSYLHNAKLMKLKAHTLDNVMSVVESMNYYPSEFELMILVKIAQVRVIVVGRKTKDNENGIAMYPDKYQSKYNSFIVMCSSYDRFNHHDVYQIAVANRTAKIPKIIMRKHEVSPPLLQLVGMM